MKVVPKFNSTRAKTNWQVPYKLAKANKTATRKPRQQLLGLLHHNKRPPS